jgi:uncharacterized membrane-anchored protein YhcB (DUF1043 family)
MFGFSPITVYAVALALVVGGLSGYKVRDLQAKAAEAKVLEKAEKQRQEIQAQLDEKAMEYEQLRASASEHHDKTISTIREIYRDVPAASPECIPPPVAIGVLNSEVNRANAAASGQPIDAVSKPKTAAPAAVGP